MVISHIREENRDIRKRELVFCDKFESLVAKSYACSRRLEIDIRKWHELSLAYFYLVRMRRDGF